ncbi:hypothetical protein ZRA01_21990 [Zoogloea ramigera]|uniref:Uncharacterized protein n=1 Tax=Zoogloea ramigera TaxID=350 RepID=A0A4Y4CUX8_ZOORA|nr:hypothetical protein ZRA01_21990 [Zoogloea ramigera]
MLHSTGVKGDIAAAGPDIAAKAAAVTAKQAARILLAEIIEIPIKPGEAPGPPGGRTVFARTPCRQPRILRRRQARAPLSYESPSDSRAPRYEAAPRPPQPGLAGPEFRVCGPRGR